MFMQIFRRLCAVRRFHSSLHLYVVSTSTWRGHIVNDRIVRVPCGHTRARTTTLIDRVERAPRLVGIVNKATMPGRQAGSSLYTMHLLLHIIGAWYRVAFRNGRKHRRYSLRASVHFETSHTVYKSISARRL